MLLPNPLLSLLLAVLWLLLSRSLAPGHLLLALLVGLFVPAATRSLRPSRVRVAAPLVALRLIAVVAFDVLMSNLHIARHLLGPKRRMPRGTFIVVPLDARDGNVLAGLAVILTLSPGTIWSEVALDRSAVLIHLFDEADEHVMAGRIKTRYEKPLMEIFE